MQSTLLEFIETLNRTMKDTMARAGQEPGLMNLTISQIQYLEAIAVSRQATVTRIAEQLKVTKPSATAAVQKLIALGYVTSTRSGGDGRVHLLELTETGRILAQAKQKALDEYEAYIRSALSGEELALFLSSIQKIILRFDEQHHLEEHS